jgi:signal transduction histidine kinase
MAGGAQPMPPSAENPIATILVVDDNEAKRSLAAHTLEDEGYRVVLASGGAEGIAAFERDLPDRIRALQRIRDARPPLTALRDVDTFDRALRAGGDEFLTKPRVFADEDLIRRTLTNLVENAIRYAPPETSVTAMAACLVGGTELRVADAGSGVPLAMREKVFSPFVQVESGERVVAHGSCGLGLTFCRVAVEAHGGRIWIEDGAPGTVFCVRLPQASNV